MLRNDPRKVKTKRMLGVGALVLHLLKRVTDKMVAPFFLCS